MNRSFQHVDVNLGGYMFNTEQIKSLKNLSFLAVVAATFIRLSCQCIYCILNYGAGISTRGLSLLVNILLGVNIIGYLFAAICFFLLFITKRELVDLVTAGLLGLYGVLLTVSELPGVMNYCYYYFYLLIDNFHIIIQIVRALILLVFVIRARKINGLMVLVGLAVLVACFFNYVIAELISEIMYNFVDYNLAWSVNCFIIYALAWLPDLFLFVESKCEN